MNEPLTDDTPAKNETDAIICCPACLRYYPVYTSMAGKLARCGRCDANFIINVTELRVGGETAIVFNNPVAVRDPFIRGGCAEMSRNAAAVLRLAGEPVTPDAVAQLVKTIPFYPSDMGERRWLAGRLNKTMEKAFHLTENTPEHGRFLKAFEYFTRYIPARTFAEIDTLTGAFAGVLSIEFDMPEPEPVTSPVERKRGWLERWAERMRW